MLYMYGLLLTMQTRFKAMKTPLSAKRTISIVTSVRGCLEQNIGQMGQLRGTRQDWQLRDILKFKGQITKKPLFRWQKMNVIHILLSLAIKIDWPLQKFNIKNAFLHGNLGEEVYIEMPLGLKENFQENKVCQLKKALYGLKQFPRAWLGRFTKAMKNMNYI